MSSALRVEVGGSMVGSTEDFLPDVARGYRTAGVTSSFPRSQ